MNQAAAPHHPVIDTHVHSWAPGGAVDYPWMPHHPSRLVTSAHTVSELDLPSSNVTALVLVQAADSLAETDFLLGAAETVPVPARVVGWLPVGDTPQLDAALQVYCAEPTLVGVRHLIHDDPDPHWLLRPDVAVGLDMLGEAGLLFELVANRLDLLALVPTVAAAHPGVTFVVDHLGKPPAGPGFAAWQQYMSHIAAYRNVAVKVSGFATSDPDPVQCARSWQRPFSVVGELFGPDRMMLGSDWPISLQHNTFARTHQILQLLLADLSIAEAIAIARGTAHRIYSF